MSRRRFIFLGIFILLVIFLPGYSKLQELKSRNNTLLTQIDNLEKENAMLTQQIEMLENDPFYIEKNYIHLN